MENNEEFVYKKSKINPEDCDIYQFGASLRVRETNEQFDDAYQHVVMHGDIVHLRQLYDECQKQKQADEAAKREIKITTEVDGTRRVQVSGAYLMKHGAVSAAEVLAQMAVKSNASA